jgi:23S rRNA pseudouridine2605 synthase
MPKLNTREKPVRIQKVIAEQGLASRRVAESWIAEGRVLVNGQPASLGDTCLPDRDTIHVDGRPLAKSTPDTVVLAMNKPRGYVCTNEDPHAQRTVFDLLPPEFANQRLFCVGRLDKESEGLLILTNDGILRQELTHPSYHIRKRYIVDLDKALDPTLVPKLIRGIHWEGERLSVDKVFPIKTATKDNWKILEITLHHGRKREIRRLLYAFGYDVKRLRRVQIGQFVMKGIPRGATLVLRQKQIRLLFEDQAVAHPS